MAKRKSGWTEENDIQTWFGANPTLMKNL